jgi:predicted DsbA family dithiol-disulfide isomerase
MEKERLERLKLENERKSAEEAEKKKLSDLEAIRERKRRMREMSLDEVLKLQKEKKKGSPTPSIRSESITYASLKRNSNESLNSVAASELNSSFISISPS